MTVGVPEAEVYKAADAVLARGERPTVERVREELGRGSPARVGSLLDNWWAQLSSRMRGESRLPTLPAEVAQAFIAVWREATVISQAIAEASVEGQRKALTTEREELAEREAASQLEVATARREAADATTAREAGETRLADLERMLSERQHQIEDLRQQRTELQGQLGDSKAELVRAKDEAEAARVEQQRYTREIEDRSYREIDRTREENKIISAQLKEAQSRTSTLQSNLQLSQQNLGKAEVQVESLQAQLAQAIQISETANLQVETLRTSLRDANAELANSREINAGLQVRTELLSEQLAAIRNAIPATSTNRPNEEAPDTAE